ncbi:S-layer homology domain-containing protein [Rothia mucilaginosa]|uniref:S-layer homology domain-containing protein n=1 Tax=Rothia mucilaginosa TaxID=43675 RepID=UPI001EFA1962|nr:S-layer homology domain-containing protein [Rothia mucilaginosa]
MADFIPVGTSEQDAASTSIYVSGDKVSPYRENNTLKVTVLGLPPLANGYYRFSLQPIDDHGRPTGQKSWEKVIPAESIQKGRAEQTLSLPGYALNFEGAYRLFVEKVTPNQGDAVDSVEQVASKDLDLDISQEREMEAARKWIVNRQLLPDYPTDRDWESVNRRSVTVALYRLAGAPQVELPAVSPYTDITPDDPDYTAIIWARQRGITFGWVDGRFHPNEPLSDRSTAAFLYRYQRFFGEASPSLPTSPSLPKPNPKKQKHFPLSSRWQLWISPETAFSRESRWAIEQRIWGYMPDQGYFYESFGGFKMSYRQVAVMLYRMEHGGSRLR